MIKADIVDLVVDLARHPARQGGDGRRNRHRVDAFRARRRRSDRAARFRRVPGQAPQARNRPKPEDRRRGDDPSRKHDPIQAGQGPAGSALIASRGAFQDAPNVSYNKVPTWHRRGSASSSWPKACSRRRRSPRPRIPARRAADASSSGRILLNWDLLGEEALLAALGKAPPMSGRDVAESFATAPIETVRLLPAAHAIRLGAIPFDAREGAHPRRVSRTPPTSPRSTRWRRRRAAVSLPASRRRSRLLQAHQKFYGRHVPLEYRPILQKLDRRTHDAASPSGRDSVGDCPPSADRLSSPTGPTAPAEPAREPRRDSHRPRRARAPAATPAARLRARGAARASGARRSCRRFRPPARLDSAPADSCDRDSLSEWVGEALSAFTGEPSPRLARLLDPSPAGVAEPVAVRTRGRRSVLRIRGRTLAVDEDGLASHQRAARVSRRRCVAPGPR